MVSVAEADRILATLVPDPSPEMVPLAEAVGRLLGLPLVADRDGPPFDQVARDGYAVGTWEGLRKWTVTGTLAAGEAPKARKGRGTAVEVTSGAVLPRGCDAVIPYEDTLRDGNLLSLDHTRPLPVPGSNVRIKGSDFLQGDILLPGGQPLKGPHLHSLASAGIDPVGVVRRPLWALVSTGNELVEVREAPKPWQLRRSNASAIVGEARAWGLKPWDETWVPDDQPALEAELRRILPAVDAVLLTGGLSAGGKDLVPTVLADLRVEPMFIQVRQNPGASFWCGRYPDGPEPAGTLVFGLPGTPVASLFLFRRYVVPWLLAAEGRPMAPVRTSAEGLEPPAPGQTVFLPWSETEGLLESKGPGDYHSLDKSTGFIELDSDPRSLAEPRYHPWG